MVLWCGFHHPSCGKCSWMFVWTPIKHVFKQGREQCAGPIWPIPNAQTWPSTTKKTQGAERSRSDMCLPLSRWIAMRIARRNVLATQKAQLPHFAPRMGKGPVTVWLASCEAILLQEVVDQKPCLGDVLTSSLATADAAWCLMFFTSNMLIDWDHLK